MIVGEKTGIIYNNEMDDFSLLNSNLDKNFISPGKRPLSSQSPFILIDSNGNIRQILGAGGGNKILTTVSQVSLINLLFHFNIKQSIDRPRLHHHALPNEIIFEKTFNRIIYLIIFFNLNLFSKDILNGLKRRGHEMKCTSYGGSAVQAIQWDYNTKQYWAYADPRKGGNTHGY
ncbi:unnamed protein product [Didymodactylos carnosus]|uniref:Uncharacterized protein n=1 Tax=Didymodactylos carnosus TaxID=1234261 RepID=A0A815HZQ5_9BILA|nr:unnamed protein product [Didymodactylos carnosus]CAF1357179.1 unnamed protein product [Didymodactylos carnosus]CAF4155036.1 unnamed protein product [Didymodactylos carnosus]CAF4232015.1 unnamed protein product [Didymodactylos carnosus]